MNKLPIYLDYNATTPVDPRVLQEMMPYFTQDFGNASSAEHSFGWKAKAAVDLARERIAHCIGSEPGEIVFTSGATESVNLALKGVFKKYQSKGNHIITCVTEHPAVLETCAALEKSGARISYLPVDANGLISLIDLENEITQHTIIIAIMYGNNETGVTQPIREIGTMARKKNVIFFCDATQALGKVPVNVNEDFIDLMAFSSHKIYGPKGCGGLFMRRKNPRVTLMPLINGGGQEKNLRSGTLNVPGIVGFGKAAELCHVFLAKESNHLKSLRNTFEKELKGRIDIQINGETANRLPNTSNITFANADGGSLISSLRKEIALSSGSACHSASLSPSHVLIAMALSPKQIKNTVRFCLGRMTTLEEIEYTVSRIVAF